MTGDDNTHKTSLAPPSFIALKLLYYLGRKILGLHLLSLRFRVYGWLYIVFMDLALVHCIHRGVAGDVTSEILHALTANYNFLNWLPMPL